MDSVAEKLKLLFAEYGLQVLAAAAILVIGWFVARVVRRTVRNLLERVKTDPSLTSFVSSLAYIVLLAFVIIAALSRLGVETTSFIAVLGAAGLAIGLALQGSLANFAAGVLLLVFRPFKAGDLIEGAGVLGVVQEVGVFVTTLKTPDNKRVIVPNAKITGDNITNYTAEGMRRVDLVVGVSYNADLKKTTQVLLDVLAADERVLKEPAPRVAVVALADSSVNFVVRPWVKTEDYWDVYFGTLQAAKERLDAEGIGIPFPQRDVHLYNES